MAKKKRHSRVEIATKLAQANGLATQGKLQSEIARTLGVSVMTLHRWRKAPPVAQPAHETGEPGQTRGGGDQIAELQLENSRLRRLVTYADLEMLFPSVPWRNPIRISDFDGNFEFACRFCIACYGIGGSDIPSLSMSAREVRRHIGEHHPWSLGHKRIRRKRLRR